MARYLVTGGSGFCGFEIVRYLRRQGHTARILDLVPPPKPLDGVEFVTGDVRDSRIVTQALTGIDHVIHTVAYVPISKAGRGFHDVNVGGTDTVLASALKRGLPKVVHLSSSSVQHHSASPVDEEAPRLAADPYSQSKLEAEEVCERYRDRGLSVDMIRPRTVLGPGRLGLFSILFDWIQKGLNVYVLGQGKNRLQFIHAEDLAACTYQCSRVSGSHTFNVGGKSYGPLREDLQDLISYAGSASRVISLPQAPAALGLRVLDWLHLSPLAPFHYLTYHKDFFVSNERALKELGWSPSRGNREILHESYESYRTAADQSSFGHTHRRPLSQRLLRVLNTALTRILP